MKIRKTEFPTIPAGTYSATVVGIEPVAGEYGDQLKWRFAVDDAGTARELWAWCSQKLSPKSKLWGWTDAILFGGLGLPAGYAEFDTADMIGRQCRIVVELTEGAGGEYNRVRNIIGASPAGVKPLAPAAVAAAVPAFDAELESEDIPF